MSQMNTYVADELQNKVKHLHTAITQAQDIISVLEQENKRIKALFGIIIGDESLVDSEYYLDKIKPQLN